MIPQNNIAVVLFVLTIVGLAVLNSSEACAHRLNVFAWIKGDQVLVECNFGEKRPASGATVEIHDAVDKKMLISGKTNDAGIFSFIVPSVARHGHGLSIDVNAGEGHHNSWNMDAAELYGAAYLTAGLEQSAIATSESAPERQDAPSGSYPVAQNPADTRAYPATNPPMPQNRADQDHMNHIRTIVREELENSIAPLSRKLAAKSSDGPSAAEIIGGFGWIAGIAGILLYFKFRRNNF